MSKQDKTKLDVFHTLRLPRGIYEQAKAIAKREDLTIGQVFRKAVREFVERAEKERA